MNEQSNPMVLSAGTQIEVSRAAEETKALFLIANAQPRNIEMCLKQMKELCTDFEAVDGNVYSYKRGTTTIEGLGIGLVEQLGLIWGRIKWGTQVIAQDNNHSEVRAMAFDYQTLVPVERIIWIPHTYKSGSTMKVLTDERDIREFVNNIAQRGVRRCIETLIGRHNIKKLLAQAKKTITFADKQSGKMEEILKSYYSDFGVTKEMLEKYLEKPMLKMTADDYGDLKLLYNALKSQETKPEEHFDFALAPTDVESKAAEAKPPAEDPKQQGVASADQQNTGNPTTLGTTPDGSQTKLKGRRGTAKQDPKPDASQIAAGSEGKSTVAVGESTGVANAHAAQTETSSKATQETSITQNVSALATTEAPAAKPPDDKLPTQQHLPAPDAWGFGAG